MSDWIADQRARGKPWHEIASQYGVSERQVRRWAQGEGEPPPAPGEMRTALILNDLHIPYTQWPLLEAAISLAEYVKPDEVIVNGDAYDCVSVSRFPKSDFSVDDVCAEVELALEKLWDPLLAVTKGAKHVFLEGNHEERIRRYLVERAPALLRRVGSVRELLGLGFVDEYREYKQWYSPAPGIYITHGDYARKNPGASAKAHAEFYHGHILVGHCHRIANYWDHTSSGDLLRVEMGHMADPATVPGGRESANWTANVGTVLRYSADGSDVNATLLPATGASVSYGDWTYSLS